MPRSGTLFGWARAAVLADWKRVPVQIAVFVLAGLLWAGSVQAATFAIPTGDQVILDMGTPDRFRTNFDGTTQTVRSVSRGDCALDTSVAQPLMHVETSSGSVGFKAGNKNDWLGLNEVGGPSGVPCARVTAPGQWIEFSLKNNPGDVLAGKTFVQTDVSFNMKRDARVSVEIRLGGTLSVTYTVYSGLNIPGSPGPLDIVCDETAGSDSGNDSQSINCMETFLGEGDEIRFIAEDGEFSIGGRNSRTVWHLSQTLVETGVLNCTEATQRVNGGFDAFGNDFEDVTLQCYRLNNVAELEGGDGLCDVVQYNLEVSCLGNATGDFDPLTACSGAIYYATEPDDPGNYEKFQFVCEMYTPAFLAEFDADGKYVLPTIEQYFGPADSQGENQEFCEGVAPHFISGAAPSFQTGGNILVNGMPALEEYESFDVPPGLDHCPDGTCGVAGQQLGCTIDRRHFQVEDLDGLVRNWVVEFFRWYLRGDYRALLTR